MTDKDSFDKGRELLSQLADISASNRAARRGGLIAKSAPTDDELEPVMGLNRNAKAIYGVDNRADMDDVADEAVLRNARSTCALLKRRDMLFAEDRWAMRTIRFGDAYRLCRGEAFEDQPIAPFCTGFLVAPDILASAGHCLTSDADVKNTLFVFGFERVDGRVRTVFNPSDVYEGASLIGRVLNHSTGADWSLIRLTRPVQGRDPLPIRRKDRIPDQQPVYVIGHPCGLPKKYAPGANVLDNADGPCFQANLDTFGGNSGSPVFSAEHEVEGILVRGATDFLTTSMGCNIAAAYPSTGVEGESVCRTTEFVGVLDDTMRGDAEEL